MPERERKQKPAPKEREEEVVEEVPATSERGEKLKEDIDDLLDEIDSVLEPFYRADRLRHRQVEGAGIGLAIANRAAILHRGVINIRNRPSGGLTVEICLPGAKTRTTGAA